MVLFKYMWLKDSHSSGGVEWWRGGRKEGHRMLQSQVKWFHKCIAHREIILDEHIVSKSLVSSITCINAIRQRK